MIYSVGLREVDDTKTFTWIHVEADDIVLAVRGAYEHVESEYDIDLIVCEIKETHIKIIRKKA